MTEQQAYAGGWSVCVHCGTLRPTQTLAPHHGAARCLDVDWCEAVVVGAKRCRNCGTFRIAGRKLVDACHACRLWAKRNPGEGEE